MSENHPPPPPPASLLAALFGDAPFDQVASEYPTARPTPAGHRPNDEPVTPLCPPPATIPPACRYNAGVQPPVSAPPPGASSTLDYDGDGLAGPLTARSDPAPYSLALDLDDEPLPEPWWIADEEPPAGADTRPWPGNDRATISEPDDDFLTDPIAEADTLLHGHGVSGGADLRDILAVLSPDQWSRRMLCRCLPGLAAAWDRLGPLVTDALHASGGRLMPDPADSLAPLLGERDALPPSITTCPVDTFLLYRNETYALRLLSPDEQRALGRWIADGRALSALPANSGQATPAGATAPAHSLLDGIMNDVTICWPAVTHVLAPRRPSSAAGWRAALVELSVAGANEDDAGRAGAALGLTTDEARATLRRAETALRLLPDETLAWLADHITRHGQPPDDAGGHGVTTFVGEAPARIARGEAATRVMIRHNLRLVFAVALKYAYGCRTLDLTDLVQEGVFGLMKAVERWEPGRGYQFSTYATWWIRQAISRSVADTDLTVRLPVHMVEQVRAALADDALAHPTHEEIRWLPADDVEQLAALTGSATARADRIDRLRAAAIPPAIASLIAGNLAPEPLDGVAHPIVTAIPDTAPSLEEHSEYQALQATLREVMAVLTERERQVLILRFGLDGSGERTLEAVGRVFGVTRERIRQIEAKALKYLRHRSLSRLLLPFTAGDNLPPVELTVKQAHEETRVTKPGLHQVTITIAPSAKLTRDEKASANPDLHDVITKLKVRLSRLSEMEQTILRLRLGLKDGHAWSHERIAEHLKLPVPVIRWREVDALPLVRDLVYSHNSSFR